MLRWAAVCPAAWAAWAWTCKFGSTPTCMTASVSTGTGARKQKACGAIVTRTQRCSSTVGDFQKSPVTVRVRGIFFDQHRRPRLLVLLPRLLGGRLVVVGRIELRAIPAPRSVLDHAIDFTQLVGGNAQRPHPAASHHH